MGTKSESLVGLCCTNLWLVLLVSFPSTSFTAKLVLEQALLTQEPL